MNKKLKNTLIITLSILSLAVIGALVFTFLSVQTIDENIAELEQSKTSYDVSASDSFENSQKKTQTYELTKTDLGDYKAIYDNGEFLFVSYSDKWDEEKLKELDEEFNKNTLGEEIKNLTHISIYPGYEDEIMIENPPYERKEYDVYLSYYNFFPKESSFLYRSHENSIALTRGDLNTEVSGMSYSLSYAYGLHFAMHNLDINGSKDDEDTAYYDLRLKGNDRVSLENDSYQEAMDDYIWSPWAIAANDYVYLMGSDTHKKIVEFYDTLEQGKLYVRNVPSDQEEYEAIQESFWYNFKLCRNALPVDNHALPIPHTVDGLADMFYSFTDEQPQEYTQTGDIGTLGLDIKDTGSDRQFKIVWDKPYEDKDVVYTLMAYDEDDEIIAAHKTINGNEEAEADIGNFKLTKRSYYYIYTYTFQGWMHFGETYRFRVTITFPDGTVVISDPIEAIFVID